MLLTVRDMAIAGHGRTALEMLAENIQCLGRDLDSLEDAIWFFGTNQYDDLALMCLERLSQLKPLTAVQHAQLGGYYFSRNSTTQGLHHCFKAYEAHPTNVGFVQLYATVLNASSRPGDAVAVLVRLIREAGPKAECFRQISSICMTAGREEQAFLAARQAWLLSSENVEYATHYCSLLMQKRNFEEVLEVLQDWGESENPTICFMLSIAASQLGQFELALKYAERALFSKVDEIDYLMQQGAVLCCLARYDEAAEIFTKILEAAPDRPDARRACFAALTEAGRFADATKIGAALVSDFPFDEQIGLTLQHILTRRFVIGNESLEGGQENLAKKIEFLAANPRVPRAKENLVALRVRSISALILREMRTRYGRSRFGYLWTIFEPLAHILVMVSLIKTFSHSAPPIGDDFAVFYFTGIIPYHLFVHTAGQMMSAVAANRPLLQLPPVKTIDVYISRGVLELVTVLVVAFLFICGFQLLGLNGIPINAMGVLLAVCILWLTAIGVGMINTVIASFFDGWERIWGAMTSLIYFSSGTFYIPRIMPEEVRNVLAWSPILQAIEMVRVSYFNEPYPVWLDVGYMGKLALITLTIGFGFELVYRRKLLDVE